MTKDFVDELFSKYKNVDFQEIKKSKKSTKRIINAENYLENNMIIQGNNIHNLKNLKNYKNDSLCIQIKSPNNLKADYLNTVNTESSNNIKRNALFDKSNSITNSNINTNPSTIHKSDILNNNFQIKNVHLLSKANKKTNVKYLYLI